MLHNFWIFLIDILLHVHVLILIINFVVLSQYDQKFSHPPCTKILVDQVLATTVYEPSRKQNWSMPEPSRVPFQNSEVLLVNNTPLSSRDPKLQEMCGAAPCGCKCALIENWTRPDLRDLKRLAVMLFVCVWSWWGVVFLLAARE